MGRFSSLKDKAKAKGLDKAAAKLMAKFGPMVVDKVLTELASLAGEDEAKAFISEYTTKLLLDQAGAFIPGPVAQYSEEIVGKAVELVVDHVWDSVKGKVIPDRMDMEIAAMEFEEAIEIAEKEDANKEAMAQRSIVVPVSAHMAPAVTPAVAPGVAPGVAPAVAPQAQELDHADIEELDDADLVEEIEPRAESPAAAPLGQAAPVAVAAAGAAVATTAAMSTTAAVAPVTTLAPAPAPQPVAAAVAPAAAAVPGAPAAPPPDALLSPEQLTPAQLKVILDSAGLPTGYDASGILTVTEGHVCLLVPDPATRTLRQLCYLNLNPAADELARLRYVNRINTELGVIRASLLDSGHLMVDWQQPIEPGLTPSAVVGSYQLFNAQLTAARGLDNAGVVA